MGNDECRYRSKVDPWILIALLVAVSILVLFAIFHDQNPIQAMLFCVIPTIWLLALSFIWPMEYILGNDMLRVRIGLVRWSIPLSSIQEVQAWSGWKTTLAVKACFSMDQLRISVRRNDRNFFITVSPDDKGAFLDDLRTRDPELILDGDGLRRKKA
jgi:hypothetical protein